MQMTHLRGGPKCNTIIICSDFLGKSWEKVHTIIVLPTVKSLTVCFNAADTASTCTWQPQQFKTTKIFCFSNLDSAVAEVLCWKSTLSGVFSVEYMHNTLLFCV